MIFNSHVVLTILRRDFRLARGAMPCLAPGPAARAGSVAVRNVLHLSVAVSRLHMNLLARLRRSKYNIAKGLPHVFRASSFGPLASNPVGDRVGQDVRHALGGISQRMIEALKQEKFPDLRPELAGEALEIGL